MLSRVPVHRLKAAELKLLAVSIVYLTKKLMPPSPFPPTCCCALPVNRHRTGLAHSLPFNLFPPRLQPSL